LNNITEEMSRPVFILIVAGILGIIATELFLPGTAYEKYYGKFDSTIQLIGSLVLIMVVRSGTTVKTVQFKIILFCLGIFILGILYKIMHWPGGFEIITISLTGVVITYAVRFINKKRKTMLDIFKMLWVVSTAIERISIVGHLIKREYLIIGNLTGWFVILFFVVEEYKKEVSEK
jgi:hypothetical protein